MEKLSIYALNLSPCKPDKTTVMQKSTIINTIFDNFNKKSNNSYDVADITMFSFCPLDNNGYTPFVEEFVNKKAKKPCILIFKSLMDISNVPKTSCGRLKKMIHQEGVLAIYFSDYSMKDTADTYLKKLIQIFNIDSNDTGKNNRKSLHPELLKQEIRRLRLLEPPVLYSDICKVIGISESTLRSIVCPPNTQKIQRT